jgi:hypothetical protein
MKIIVNSIITLETFVFNIDIDKSPDLFEWNCQPEIEG